MKLFTTLSISAILALSLNAKESTPVVSLQHKSDIEKSGLIKKNSGLIILFSYS